MDVYRGVVDLTGADHAIRFRDIVCVAFDYGKNQAIYH